MRGLACPSPASTNSATSTMCDIRCVLGYVSRVVQSSSASRSENAQPDRDAAGYRLPLPVPQLSATLRVRQALVTALRESPNVSPERRSRNRPNRSSTSRSPTTRRSRLSHSSPTRRSRSRRWPGCTPNMYHPTKTGGMGTAEPSATDPAQDAGPRPPAHGPPPDSANGPASAQRSPPTVDTS